jgi:putative thioredoxin
MPLEVTNFDSEVIARSYERPILVDFWAPWCGPCRMIGPVLEKMADEADGWELAKVNTDEQQEVARRYSIMSIPAVKLFSHGEVVDEFVGALPEAQVRAWLEKALPSKHQDAVERARASMTDNPAEAQALLKTVLENEPGNAAARALLAQALVFQDPQKAMEMLDGADLRDPVPIRIADAVGVLAHLANLRLDAAALGDGPGREAYLEAAGLIAAQDFAAAFDTLLRVVRTDRKLDEDGARKSMLALFTLLGEENPLTPQYRRQLERALF